MYARFVMFTLGPGKRPFAEKMADQFNAAMKNLNGFKSATFLVDESTGEYGMLSLWETKADAESAANALAAGFQQALQGHVQGPPTQRTLEVYEPELGDRKSVG